ncbi:hypothetical protein [Methylobacterium sp. B1]|uniref:DUF6889 family protein n=1 Tax=Methylobacterium sp. B1 TaxID=91459 RepID=UPI00034D57FB|nr:hypothetical protein [Methylobacterium sp. B1]
MPDGEDFYMGPIPLGYYSLTDLKLGLIHIEDIAECNDAMRVEAENRARLNPTS